MYSSPGKFITAIRTGIRGKNSPIVNDLLWHLGPPIILLLIFFLFFPTRSKFEFSADEGINLMKAMLIERGYKMYDQIWSDQPPLFSFLLAGLMRVFGYKVGVTRTFVLILSAILLWANIQFLRMNWGNKQAVFGAIFLFLLPTYISLSVSTMLGLPSITFATLSILSLAAWHKKRRYTWLILSAAALGISILIKLFTGFLAPIIVLGILIGEYTRTNDGRNWIKILTPVFLWGAVFSILSIGIGFLLVGPQNVLQLIETHLLASDVVSFDEWYFTIHRYTRYLRPLLFLAIVGTVITIRKRNWTSLYPFFWMVIAYLLLLNHTPVWWHHQLLISVPATILAGITVGEIAPTVPKLIEWGQFKDTRGLIQLAGLIGLFFFVFSVRVPGGLENFNPLPSLTTTGLNLGMEREKILANMIRRAPETNWVVTDLPMYAFRARLSVPPNLAVFSQKRFLTGNLTEQEVIDTIQEYQPEQILLGRQTYPLIEEYLENGYYQYFVTGDEETRLYFRNDL